MPPKKKDDADGKDANAKASTPLIALTTDGDACGEKSQHVWGKRDRGCLGGYNDVVSRFPSFQIFLFAIISAATLAVLHGQAMDSGDKAEVLSAFVGSAAVETM